MKAKKTVQSVTEAGDAGFTDEERDAMKERAQELRAEAGAAPRSSKPDGEAEVLAKIAGMPEADRALA